MQAGDGLIVALARDAMTCIGIARAPCKSGMMRTRFSEPPMLLLKIDLCEACAETLREIQRERGRKALNSRAGSVLRNCATCRLQLPVFEGPRKLRFQFEQERVVSPHGAI
jgi:uncharacterized protein with PIN domain